MTLTTLAILGATASIVVLKLAVFAFIVALAAKSLTHTYKFNMKADNA